jgi:hypothetical protein
VTKRAFIQKEKFEAFLRSENSGLIYDKSKFAIDPRKAKSFLERFLSASS